MSIPRIETDRLILRAHRPDDFPLYQAEMAMERTRYMGGPYETVKEAWGLFCHDTACWAFYGHGALAVDLKDGTKVGQVGINGGPLFPEREIGWTAYSDHEGQGYMSEAARALRAWYFETFGPGRLVSYIDPGNARSIAVAERLGATRDPGAPVQDPGDLVYLHPLPEVAL